jgi:hypothetical protein
MPPRFYFSQEANGANGVLVDGVVMIHVELHLRHHATKIGDETTENSGFVHPAQHSFRVRCEQRISRNNWFARPSLRTLLSISLASRRPHCAWQADGSPANSRSAKWNSSISLTGSRLQEIASDGAMPVFHDRADKAIQLSGFTRKTGQEASAFFRMGLVEMRKEQAGQIAYRLWRSGK